MKPVLLYREAQNHLRHGVPYVVRCDHIEASGGRRLPVTPIHARYAADIIFRLIMPACIPERTSASKLRRVRRRG